jgi:hypothetical protein
MTMNHESNMEIDKVTFSHALWTFLASLRQTLVFLPSFSFLLGPTGLTCYCPSVFVHLMTSHYSNTGLIDQQPLKLSRLHQN